MNRPRWEEHPGNPQVAGISTAGPIDWDLHDLQRAREEQGECPNGCGDTMVVLDAHSRECRSCHYHSWSNVPHGYA